MPRKQSKKPVSRHLLGQGLSLLAIGVGLMAVSSMLGSNANQVVRSVAGGLRFPVPYALGLGTLLVLVGYLLRPRTKPVSAPPTSDPIWFPADPDEAARSALQVQRQSAAHPPQRPRRAPAAAWGLQVFDDIEWKRFETLCAELFAQAGFEARTQSHGADGGVDIWLHSRNAVGPVAVVQCKHWLAKPVGVKEVRELLGVMTAHKVSRGTFVTTSRFSDDAAQFAKDNGIHLLDVQGLLALIARRTPAQQQALLQHAYEGEYWRPTCASCGLRMMERTQRKGGSAFWGCTAYPGCRFTLPMKAGA